MIVFIWGMRTAIAIIVALALVPAAHAQQPHPGKRGKGKITRVAYEFATSVKLELEFEIGTVGSGCPQPATCPREGRACATPSCPADGARVPCAEQLRVWTETAWMNDLRYTMQIFLSAISLAPGSCDRVDAGQNVHFGPCSRKWANPVARLMAQ